MPRKYEALKESLREQHPAMPLHEVKRIAAATYEKHRQPGEMHIQTAAARERAHKVKGIGHRKNFKHEE